MPNKDNKILKYIQGEKSMKAPFIIYSDKENNSYEKQNVCYICKREFSTDENDKNAFKLYHKVTDHIHHTGNIRGASHSICNLRYKTPKEIPIVFHNGFTYDDQFTISKLAKEL